MDRLERLSEKLKNAEGYLLAITILKDGKLEHSLITKNFPKVDMLKSNAEIKQLIIQELEGLERRSFGRFSLEE